MPQSLPASRQTTLPVDPQFPARWSPRAYTSDALSVTQVETLLEAARFAPSAMNIQPARLVWALRGETAFDTIAATLAPFNQVWASKAGALIVVASDQMRASDAGPVANPWASFDAGAAWMSLALQARAMGLAAHAMGGFDAATLAPAIGLPEGHALHAVVAVGVQGDADTLPEALAARETPSPRKPLAEVTRHARF